jgi:hypothetical protein
MGALQHDDLSLPNGSVIGQTDNETLRRIFADLGIPDAWTLGCDRLVERYVAMLKKIFDDASQRAVSAFLDSKKDISGA